MALVNLVAAEHLDAHADLAGGGLSKMVFRQCQHVWPGPILADFVEVVFGI